LPQLADQNNDARYVRLWHEAEVNRRRMVRPLIGRGGYQANPPSPLLRRCEVFASDQDEAVVVAKGRVDGASLL